MNRTLIILSFISILTSTAVADVALVQDRLSVDVLAWSNSAWKWSEALGYVTTDFSFYRFGAPVGLTGFISKTASLRVSIDGGLYMGALDLYADFRWASGFGLRAGQFVAPVGLEALTDPKALEFIEYSVVRNAWKPLDPRDVGLMGSYENRLAELTVAVLNGNGRGGWLQDDNRWKDLCGRLLVRPFVSSGVLFGLRTYCGRTGTEGTGFRNLAIEAEVSRGRLEARCELQNAAIGQTTYKSFYVQASYRLLAVLKTAARFQMSFSTGSVRNVGVTGGLNFPIRGDDLKVMIDYDYRRQGAPGIESDFTRHEILLQLQAAL